MGDRIMWAHADCGGCYWCNIAREPVLCARRSGYGWAPPSALRGGFAENEYVTPSTEVVRVPDELTEEEAIGVGCAFRSVIGGYERFGHIRLMEDFVIQGSGPIGLYSTVVTRESGARKIIVVGAPSNRLELARRWGADHVIDIQAVPSAEERRQLIIELTEGRGPLNVVEATGVPAFPVEGRISAMTLLNNSLVPGADVYVEAGWIVAMPDPNPHIGEHVHDYDEIVLHLGTDPEDQEDLGAEIEFVVDGRPCTITKTSCVFVPKGVKHGPLTWKSFTRPHLELTIMLSAGSLQEADPGGHQKTLAQRLTGERVSEQQSVGDRATPGKRDEPKEGGQP